MNIDRDESDVERRNRECGSVNRFTEEEIAAMPADEQPGPGQLRVFDLVTQDWIDAGDEVIIRGICASRSALRDWLQSLTDRSDLPTFPADNLPLTADDVRKLGLNPADFRAFRIVPRPEAARAPVRRQLRFVVPPQTTQRPSSERRFARGDEAEFVVSIEDDYDPAVFETETYLRHATIVRSTILNALVGGLTTDDGFAAVLDALTWRVEVNTERDASESPEVRQSGVLVYAVPYDAQRDNLIGHLIDAYEQRNTMVRRLLGWFDPALWQLVLTHIVTTYRRPTNERVSMTYGAFEELLARAYDADNLALMQALLGNRLMPINDETPGERERYAFGIEPSVEFCQNRWPPTRAEREVMYKEPRRMLLDSACTRLGVYAEPTHLYRPIERQAPGDEE